MNTVVKSALKGAIPTLVLVGGTNLIVKKFRESKPVLYWGSLAVATGVAVAVVQGRITTPFMNAETFDADSLKGRWDEGTTRIIHGVEVTKTRYGGEMWEKPQYLCKYNGYSCRIFYEGVAFYLPCWMYRGYGGVGRQGCFTNPMEAILDFKKRAE